MKQYVGITMDMGKRWNEHKIVSNTKTALGRAMQKYGAVNFVIEHVASATEWKNAGMVEAALIKQLNTRSPYGYNLTDGGDGTLGFRHTPEECQRRSERCPTRNPEVMKLIADKQRGVKRPHTSGENNPLYGRRGAASHMTKYVIVATNIVTQEKQILIGAAEIDRAGFNRARVYECAKKVPSRITHKNHTFEFQKEPV